jgi:peptide chain release factor 2
MRRELGELEAQSVVPGFWDDAGRAQRLMQRLTGIRNQIDEWERMSQQAVDLLELYELAEDDEEMVAEITTQTNQLAHQLDQMEIQLLLSGEHDESNALLAIHAGTGGIDAQDWAEMLSRMYLRWAAKRDFSTSILDWTEGEEAGIKSTTIEIRGRYAYGLLKGEAGTHRLVRLSPFDSAHRRHTAFALVEVLPEVENDSEVEIRDEDIRLDTYRSSGAGGQHVNKTSSAIRITHFPTGIVVTCQDERSQLQNKESAFKILRSRLVELKLREQEAERARLKGEHVTEGWGNRIRSYVLQPYTMVNDHRTDFSTSNVQAVLDGDLDPAIESYLHQQLQDQQEQVRAD